MATLVLLSGGAHPGLGGAVARALGVELGECLLERFPDGEAHVEVRTDVGNADTFIVQPLGKPVGESLLELLLISDACRRAGAGRVTAVVPYLSYARQDRRTHEGEPLGARLIADLVGARVDRVMAVDLHAAALEGACVAPLDHLTAVPLLAAALRPHAERDGVIVAPDHGATKLADAVARELDLPAAFVHKTRLSGTDVAARGVLGEVKGRAPILVDDMIVTGGTIAAAARALLAQGCAPRVTIAATHGLFAGPAVDRLGGLPLCRAVVTDSLPTPELPFACEVVSLGPLLADAIRRRHEGRPLAGLLSAR